MSKIKLFILGFIAIVALSFIFSTFETVDAGERGIVLVWGKPTQLLEPGFHMVNPISSDIVTMNVQVQKYEAKADAASKDLQTVTSTIALNYHIDPSQLMALYTNVGVDFEGQLIPPAIQESVKAATAGFTAEELISKRPAVKEAIKLVLNPRLGVYGLIVDDFSITNFDFSAEFNRAVESKVTAEQNALASKNKLEQVKFEAEQSVAKAKAEAESTRLQVQALQQGSEVIKLRQTEALLELAKRWDGKLPVNVYGSAPLPFLNLAQ